MSENPDGAPPVMTRPILCLAITPAVQRTQFFKALRPGEVNRARRTLITASGKGVNVALAVQHLGGTARLVGFCGGDSGRFVAAAMKDGGLDARWVETAAPTRHCHTLIDEQSGQVTELVEEATPPGPAHWQAFQQELERALPGCAWLAISGALPPGAPAGALSAIAYLATSLSVSICVDSQGEPLLRTLAARPALIKLNTEELATTCGLANTNLASLSQGARQLQEQGAGAVLVTDGPHAAYLFHAGQTWLLQPPPVPVINPIGSGDSVTAGLLVALQSGQPLAQAAAFGLACGSANAETETPAQFTAARARELIDAVRITPA